MFFCAFFNWLESENLIDLEIKLGEFGESSQSWHLRNLIGIIIYEFLCLLSFVQLAYKFPIIFFLLRNVKNVLPRGMRAPRKPLSRWIFLPNADLVKISMNTKSLRREYFPEPLGKYDTFHFNEKHQTIIINKKRKISLILSDFSPLFIGLNAHGKYESNKKNIIK